MKLCLHYCKIMILPASIWNLTYAAYYNLSHGHNPQQCYMTFEYNSNIK